MRSGDEPVHARSPLRLRFFLAASGACCWATGAVALGIYGAGTWSIGCGLVALLATVNTLVVARHRRAGPHWQPGPNIPPYRPAEHIEPTGGGGTGAVAATPTQRRRAPVSVRARRYLALMGTCLGLLIVAWGWVRQTSTTAALIMSMIALPLPPLAVIVANLGSLGDLPADAGDRGQRQSRAGLSS